MQSYTYCFTQKSLHVIQARAEKRALIAMCLNLSLEADKQKPCLELGIAIRSEWICYIIIVVVLCLIVNMMSLWLCRAASFRSGPLVIHTTKDPGLFEVKEWRSKDFDGSSLPWADAKSCRLSYIYGPAVWPKEPRAIEGKWSDVTRNNVRSYSIKILELFQPWI